MVKIQKRKNKTRKRNLIVPGKTIYYQNAGDLIGQGAYGCVYNPPLKCKDKPHFDYTNKVSKLMTKDAALDEMYEYNNIEDIDPEHKFHLLKPVVCDLADPFTEEEQYADCGVIKPYMFSNPRAYMNNFKLLQNENGGQSLTQYINNNLHKLKTKEGLNKFLLQLEPLFLGLKEMHLNNFCHFDIKTDNIVISEAKGAQYIDFGLSFKTDEIRTFNDLDNIDYVTSIAYYPHPLELFLLSNNAMMIIDEGIEYFERKNGDEYGDDLENMENTEENAVKLIHLYMERAFKGGFLKHIITQSINKTKDLEPTILVNSKIFNFDSDEEKEIALNKEYEMIKQYYEKIFSKKFGRNILNITELKNILTKVDVYSIGLILLEFLTLITEKNFKQGMNYETATEMYNGNDIHVKLYYLIQQMVKGRYTDRYNGEEAYNHYLSFKEQILSSMQSGGKKKRKLTKRKNKRLRKTRRK